MAVIAVSGDQIIVGPRRRDRTGDDRFLADVKVAKPADPISALVLLGGALLEAPDQQHLREHVDFLFFDQTFIHSSRAAEV